jgi:hypothetical protein
MEKWYQATCAVRFGRALSMNSNAPGEVPGETAKGYVIVVGVSASNIAEAAGVASNLALKAFDGPGEGNEVEEIQIKSENLTHIKRQLGAELIDNSGCCYYRSGLCYYSE